VASPQGEPQLLLALPQGPRGALLRLKRLGVSAPGATHLCGGEPSDDRSKQQGHREPRAKRPPDERADLGQESCSLRLLDLDERAQARANVLREVLPFRRLVEAPGAGRYFAGSLDLLEGTLLPEVHQRANRSQAVRLRSVVDQVPLQPLYLERDTPFRLPVRGQQSSVSRQEVSAQRELSVDHQPFQGVRPRDDQVRTLHHPVEALQQYDGAHQEGGCNTECYDGGDRGAVEATPELGFDPSRLAGRVRAFGRVPVLQR